MCLLKAQQSMQEQHWGRDREVISLSYFCALIGEYSLFWCRDTWSAKQIGLGICDWLWEKGALGAK